MYTIKSLFKIMFNNKPKLVCKAMKPIKLIVLYKWDHS